MSGDILTYEGERHPLVVDGVLDTLIECVLEARGITYRTDCQYQWGKNRVLALNELDCMVVEYQSSQPEWSFWMTFDGVIYSKWDKVEDIPTAVNYMQHCMAVAWCEPFNVRRDRGQKAIISEIMSMSEIRLQATLTKSELAIVRQFQEYLKLTPEEISVRVA